MSSPNGLAKRTVFRALLLLMVATASGCFSSVRLIQETPNGGVISLPSNSNQWPTFHRKQAEALMYKKCPEGYVIDHEEVFEDNPASEDGRKAKEDFDYNGAYERITNYARKEYHITFHGAHVEKRPLSLDAPAKPGKGSSPTRPPSSPAGERTEELPPPRPLSPPLGRE